LGVSETLLKHIDCPADALSCAARTAQEGWGETLKASIVGLADSDGGHR
jgi:hypothetical protein